MKGNFSWVAIFAITLAVVDVEADKLRELPTKLNNNYQSYVCEEDTTESHDSKCNLYYKCINKQLVLKECENGLHWDQMRKVCTTPEKAECPNYNLKVCKEGSYKSNDKECDSYYKCKNNQWNNKKCPIGMHWNQEQSICTSVEEANCKNVVDPVTCEEGSYKHHNEKCERYYKCKNNQWDTKECPIGMHWNRDQSLCTYPEQSKCKNVDAGTCKEGSYKHHNEKCERYYKCKNNQWYNKECPIGLLWNRKHAICTSPEEANCGNHLCKEGSYKPNDKVCNKYFKCKNNQWNKKECPPGLHWNRDHTICTSPEISNCENDLCKEGSYKPNDKECDSYYKCKNNQWYNKECPTGMHWNQDYTICTPPEVANCDIDLCEEGSYRVNSKECHRYYKCKNNQWDIRECPIGMHWNREHTICTYPEQSKCNLAL